MPFKKITHFPTTADSPEAMYHDFRNRHIAGLLSHQADIIRQYHKNFGEKRDVALQLPTGSGKTLVGLVIAEWQRRKHQRRPVYLCPTRQLVHQVVDQATTKYGIRATAFVGKQKEYAPSDRAEYHSNDTIAVTTYNGFFNTNTFFDNATVAIFDDAHAAENYVAKYWSLEISRYDNKPFYLALLSALKDLIESADYLRLAPDRKRALGDAQWVEKLPTQELARIATEVIGLIDEYATEDRLKYPWLVLRDHFLACHIYLSFDSILIRPLICPTETHAPFANLKQRIYMSATLGAAGELERLWGIADIARVPVPEGWDKQGIGRRFFLFPQQTLDDEDAVGLATDLIEQVPRAVILPPDKRAEEELGKTVASGTGYSIFDADAIEKSKSKFIKSEKSVAIMAARYDGIDFNGDDCRLLVLAGLPRALNVQERFLTWRMSAGVVLKDRVLTRVVQGAGRCTRSATDYACVVVLGQDLTRFFQESENRSLLHPELQAEIKFGLEQSAEASEKEFAEFLQHFIEQDDEWAEAEEQIVTLRDGMAQQPMPASTVLRAAVAHEVRYQYAMWSGNYDSAVGESKSVLAALTGNEVRGYRAFWHYLAGSAASLAAREGAGGMEAVARDNYRRSVATLPAVKWLNRLCRGNDEPAVTDPRDALVALLVEGLERRLDQLGTVNTRRFEAEVKLIVEGLQQIDAKPFEAAHEHLGRLLGYDASRSDDDAAPDTWWQLGDAFCIVFEDHTNVKDPNQPIGATKIRQAGSHPNWVIAHLGVRERSAILPVLVSPCSALSSGAAPHAGDLCYWHTTEMFKWVQEAIDLVRTLWRAFPGPGDLAWRAQAMSAIKVASKDPLIFRRMLGGQRLDALPVIGGDE